MAAKADYPFVIMLSGAAGLLSETDARPMRGAFRVYTSPSLDIPEGRNLHVGMIVGRCRPASVPHNEKRPACGEALFLFSGYGTFDYRTLVFTCSCAGV